MSGMMWYFPIWVLSWVLLFLSFQFCLMEHFFESPLSVLCCVSSDDRKDLLNEMSHEQVEMFRKTMSFRRLILQFFLSTISHFSRFCRRTFYLCVGSWEHLPDNTWKLYFILLKLERNVGFFPQQRNFC